MAEFFAPEQALAWMARLIGFAAFLQTLEFFQIRKTFTLGGIWDWIVLRDDYVRFPGFMRLAFDVLMGDRQFFWVLALRLVSAVWVMWSPQSLWIVALFFTSLLVCVRWRGTFNGGSDYMTLIVLVALCVTSMSDHPSLVDAALGYVAVQACLSYFVAGVAKLRISDWRKGRALGLFLTSSYYDVPSVVKRMAGQSTLMKFASWGLMIFELSFPIALLNRELCLVFLILAFVFHVANAAVLGLNRFVFAWLAAYPAVIYWSGIIIV